MSQIEKSKFKVTKQRTPDGEWEIHIADTPKMWGILPVTIVCIIDEQYAQWIVDSLNKNISERPYGVVDIRKDNKDSSNEN